MPFKNIFILVLVFILFFACNKIPDNNLDDQANNTSVNAPSVYDLKMKKINVIVNCFNGYSKSAFIAYQEYISFFGNDVERYKPKEIPDFTEVNAYDVQNLKSLEDVLDIPVLDELNSLITSYKINARAFSVAMNSCERYYTNKGYKKDNFENGKGMHKPVIEIFERFSVADSLLRVKSNKISKNLELEHLNELKKNGLEVEYLSIIGKKEANKLNTLLISTSYDDLNIKELKVLHDKIKDVYDKFIVLKNSETKQFNAENTIYYNALEQFFKSVNELYLRKKEKKKFSKKELKKLKQNEVMASSVVGSTNAVIYAYKKLILSFKDISNKQGYTNSKLVNVKGKMTNSIKIPNAIK